MRCMAELALEEAYRKWSEDLGRYATVLVGRSRAPDVVADAIVSVIGSGRWHGVSNPKAYLLTAVLNSARMTARAGARRAEREARTAQPEVLPILESQVDAQKSLECLSLQQRAIVHLTYWEDQTPSAVGEILGTSEGSVWRQLARARAKLRKVITNDSD